MVLRHRELIEYSIQCGEGLIQGGKGKLIEYSVQRGEGLIKGEKGYYSFQSSEWASSTAPQAGMRVNFEVNGQTARRVSVSTATGKFMQAGQSVQAGVAANQGVLRGFASVLGRIVRKVFVGSTVLLVAMAVIGEFLRRAAPESIQEPSLSVERARIIEEGLRDGFAADPKFNFPQYCQVETNTNREYADCIGLAQSAATGARAQ